MTDVVLFWSEVANECNRLDHTNKKAGAGHNRGPIYSSRAMAMVHIAIHDAYFGVAGFDVIPYISDLSPYLTEPPTYMLPATPVAIASAVSAAAATMLVNLYPDVSYRLLIEEKLIEIAGLRGTDAKAFDFGREVAHAVLDLRREDGSRRSYQHIPSSAPYHHRADPASPAQGYDGASYGENTHTFVVNDLPFIAVPPLPINNNVAIYQRDFDEVYTKGGASTLNSTDRTSDETAIGLFWGYDGAEKIGTPPRLYNQILHAIAKQKGNTEAENARLFALAGVAMGDSGIYAWLNKYHYDVWRPVVGIREHHVTAIGSAIKTEDNPTAGDNPINPQCDPSWLPLGRPASNEVGVFSRTPDFPAYPSGHATFGASVFEIIRLFYAQKEGQYDPCAIDNSEDNIAFHFVSDELNGKTIDSDGSVRVRHVRRFNSVAQAMYENSVSRIYLGVHWRFDGTSGHTIKEMLEAKDNIGGVPLGRTIAQKIFEGFKQPCMSQPPKK